MSEFNTQTNEEPIEILELLQLLLDNAKFIVIATISIGILSALYISSVERTYIATTLIKSSSKVGSTGDSAASGLAGLLGVQASTAIVSNQNDIDSTIAIMISREFLEKFIVDHDLLKEIFIDDWDRENNTWKNEVPLITDGYYLLREAIKVTFDPIAFTRRQIGFAELEVAWPNGKTAAYIANNLVKDLNQFLASQMIVEAESSVEFIDQQFTKTNVLAFRESLSKLKTEQIRNMMLANSSKDFALRVIDDALIPEFPSTPKRMQFVLIATALGLIASIVFDFLRMFILPNLKKLKLPI